jgi:magnesium chelatase subunit H
MPRRWAATWRPPRCASSPTPRGLWLERQRAGRQLAFGDEDELADAYEARKSFAYGATARRRRTPPAAGRAEGRRPRLSEPRKRRAGVTTVDHYFDTLGGIARAVKRAKGGQEAPSTSATDPRRRQGAHAAGSGGAGDPLAQPEPEMVRGPAEARPEGVRQIEAQVTNTLGWSATTGQVEPWVYQRLSRPSCWTKRCAAGWPS